MQIIRSRKQFFIALLCILATITPVMLGAATYDAEDFTASTVYLKRIYRGGSYFQIQVILGGGGSWTRSNNEWTWSGTTTTGAGFKFEVYQLDEWLTGQSCKIELKHPDHTYFTEIASDPYGPDPARCDETVTRQGLVNDSLAKSIGSGWYKTQVRFYGTFKFLGATTSYESIFYIIFKNT